MDIFGKVNALAKKRLRWLQKLTDVNSSDPSQRRRGKMLNTILLWFVGIALLAMVANLIGQAIGIYENEDVLFTYFIASFIIAGIVIIFWISKNRSVDWSAGLFIVFLTFALFFGDTIEESVRGRNMLMLVIPILLAGLILRPIFSFYVAFGIGLLSIVFSLLTPSVDANIFGIFGYVAAALISYLTTRHLERVVEDIQVANLELDKRVALRTRELRKTNLHLEGEIAERKQAQKALEIERSLLTERVEERTAEIRSTNEELRRMARIKDEFLANMSHELRTPLNAIIGYSEVMLEEAEIENNLEEIYINDISRVRQAGQHLLRIINDILDLSKIEANQMTLDVVDFSIKSLVHSVVETVRPMSNRQSNKIEVNLLTENDEMISDPQKIQQILLNLLSNAAKFTENGLISISTYTVQNNRVCFEVRDTGIGIPPAAVQNIFESFRQVDNSMSRSFEGTGLGLTISKRLSEILGGTIEVESELGRGTVFRLCIRQRLMATNPPAVEHLM